MSHPVEAIGMLILSVPMLIAGFVGIRHEPGIAIYGIGYGLSGLILAWSIW